MQEFLLGILASLCASMLAVVYVRYGHPQHLRRFFMILACRVLGCGIDRVFRNEDDASEDILKSSSSSDFIRVLSIRGFRLTNQERPLSRLLAQDNNYTSLEVMIAKPSSAAVTKRAQGFAEQAIAYPQTSLYKDDVVKSLNVLFTAGDRNKKIRVRMHTQCESFRLFFTEDYLYLSFYPKGRSASQSPVFRIKKSTFLYDAFVEHYNWVRRTQSEEYTGQYLYEGV